MTEDRLEAVVGPSLAEMNDRARDAYWTGGCGADVLKRDQALVAQDTLRRTIAEAREVERVARERLTEYAAVIARAIELREFAEKRLAARLSLPLEAQGSLVQGPLRVPAFVPSDRPVAGSDGPVWTGGAPVDAVQVVARPEPPLAERAGAALMAAAGHEGAIVYAAGDVMTEMRRLGWIGLRGGLTRAGSIEREKRMNADIERLFPL